MPTIGAKVTNEELAIIAGYATKLGLTISQLIKAATLREDTAAEDIAYLLNENDRPFEFHRSHDVIRYSTEHKRTTPNKIFHSTMCSI